MTICWCKDQMTFVNSNNAAKARILHEYDTMSPATIWASVCEMWGITTHEAASRYWLTGCRYECNTISRCISPPPGATTSPRRGRWPAVAPTGSTMSSCSTIFQTVCPSAFQKRIRLITFVHPKGFWREAHEKSSVAELNKLSEGWLRWQAWNRQNTANLHRVTKESIRCCEPTETIMKEIRTRKSRILVIGRCRTSFLYYFLY